MQASFNLNRWFLPLLLVFGSATILLTYLVVAGQQTDTLRSQNIARAQALKADISLLPAVIKIVPAETSGMLDYTVSTRTNLLQRMRSDLAPQSAFFLYRLHPAYRVDEVSIQLHRSALAPISDQLEKTSVALVDLKKLIEYDPKADLPERFADDPVIDERLTRIYEGFNESAAYIKTSTLVHRNQIASALTELNKKTLTLNEVNLTEWTKELLAIQTLIIEDIAAQDIQSTDFGNRLDAVAGAYQ